MADVLVLCYHAISPSWDVELSVTPAALERQLTHLVRSGWTVVPFTEAVHAPPSRRTLALTFDDAFASVFTLAAPLLRALGVRGTLYVPTRPITDGTLLAWEGLDRWVGTRQEPELEPMSWQQVGELADAGWEIGSHTCTHPFLTRLDDDQLNEELERSQTECRQHLGRPCESIAYPYGDVDARVAARAAAAGYRAGACLSSRLEDLGPMRVPRTGIYHEEAWWRFRLKLTRGMRLVRASRLWTRQ